MRGNSSTRPSCLPGHYWAASDGGAWPRARVRAVAPVPGAVMKHAADTSRSADPRLELISSLLLGTGSHVVFICLWCVQGFTSSHPSAVGAVTDKPGAAAAPLTRWHAAQTAMAAAAAADRLCGASCWPRRSQQPAPLPGREQLCCMQGEFSHTFVTTQAIFKNSFHQA